MSGGGGEKQLLHLVFRGEQRKLGRAMLNRRALDNVADADRLFVPDLKGSGLH